MTEIRKNILFVDYDTNLLDFIRQLVARLAGNMRDIYSARDVRLALMTLQHQRVNLLVIERGTSYVPDASKAA